MLRSSTRRPEEVPSSLASRRVLHSGRGYPHGVLGFFSFTEVTDPSAHEAYNAWHQLDHLPEQFTVEGITFGQRWVRSPRCQAAEAATGSLLDRFHYMTLYLMRDEGVLPAFFALADRLRAEDRFFAARRALLSGPFDVADRWVAPRVAVSAEAVPFRPSCGVYVVVGPPVDGAALVARRGRRRLGVRRRRATAAPSRSPSSTATCGRPRPRSGPAAGGIPPNGRAPWSVLMPFAGTGSLR